MKGRLFAGVALAIWVHGAHAADIVGKMPVKDPPAAAYDWTGFYLGGHVGYALGGSNWSSTPGPGGTLDFSNGYNFSAGTGSYLVGLQAGYDYQAASHWVVGIETDVSFPNFVGGNQTFASPATGTANYLEQVELSGTLRGRLGYTPELGAAGHWLFYVTGGFAWSYDQFSRSQFAGVPAGGTATPGTVENLFMVPRAGGAVGAGVEVGLAAHWTAHLQYLFLDYADRSVTFPAGAQRFDSGLTLNELRFGLDYRFNNDSSKSADKDVEPPALQTDNFAVHGQMTFIEQYDAPFHSPYLGPHSLDPNQGRESWDVMYFLGARLWQGAELWVDPEIDQGFGLSNTTGVDGFPSGASFKVGAAVPYARVQRAFIRQTIDLGGDSEKVAADQNQFSGSNTTDRLVVTVGKFSVSDVFDQNKYAQNPRKDFMNWALIDSGSFDYAADAWGYTYGAAAEWYRGDWTLRGGVFDLSKVPNDTNLDTSFAQFQWIGEVERRYELWSHPGKIAVTAFLDRARLGTYDDAVALAMMTGSAADTALVRQYRSRGGVSVNLEQELTSDLGLFARAGLANGNVEPDSYTDIDRTVAAGLSLKGTQWGRADDTFAVAGIVNGISKAQQAYLNAGGLGILDGDGQLPHPGLEQIVETYYLFPIAKWNTTFDYQFVINPAFNRDRGPVSIVSVRLETDF